MSVTSTTTGAQFFGYTLENARPPNAALPVSARTLSAFIRSDHSPNRIELTGVPNARNVQFHAGNTASDLIGCIAPGTTQSRDFVGGSKAAMAAILGIIKSDGGAITVVIAGDGRR